MFAYHIWAQLDLVIWESRYSNELGIIKTGTFTYKG
jgi:hypothetical protein